MMSGFDLGRYRKEFSMGWKPKVRHKYKRTEEIVAPNRVITYVQYSMCGRNTSSSKIILRSMWRSVDCKACLRSKSRLRRERLK